MKNSIIKRGISGAVHLLGGLGTGLAIMIALSAWKLSSGPISLAFLSPYFESTLATFHKSSRIRLDDTILTWAGWERTLDIRVINVRVLGENDTLIASIPELSLSFSAKALIRGMIAPKTIEMFRPSLKVIRHQNGSLEVGFNTEGANSDEFLQQLFDVLLQKLGPSHPMSYLSRVSILDADLQVFDQSLKTSWNAPNAQIQLLRGANGITSDVTMDVLVGDTKANVSVQGEYISAERRFDLGIDFNQIKPAAYARLSPELSALAGIEVPLQGTLTLSMLGDGTVESFGFDVVGSKGMVSLPVKTAKSIGLLHLAQRVKVEAIEFRGRYEGRHKKTEISNLTLELGAQGKVYLPPPFDHEMPLKALNARGRYFGDSSRFELDVLELDLNGPHASIALNLVSDDGGVSLGASGVLRDIHWDNFSTHWPRSLATKARKWVIGHVAQGRVPEARAVLQAHYSEDTGFELLTLNGNMNIRGAEVDYLPPMPKVANIMATARFNKKKFDIFITQAQVEGISTRKSVISFRGLDQIDTYVDMDLFIKGPLKNAFSLIEHEPLGFVSAVGASSDQVNGTADAHIKLNFLVKDSLSTDDVDFTVAARLHDVSVDNIITGQGIQNGQLYLKVSKQGLDLTGDVRVGNIPASFEWRHNFGVDAPYRGHYKIVSNIDNIQNLSELGIDFPPLLGDFIEGGVAVDIQLTTHDGGKDQVQVRLDLDDLFLSAPAMGWSKKVGVAGVAHVNLEIDGTRAINIPKFSLAAGGLRIHGSASYAEDGTGLDRVDIDQISFNRTDLAGVLIPGIDGGWTISFHGPSFDLEPLFEDLFKSSPADEDGFGLMLSLSANVDKVWLGQKRFIKHIAGTLNRADNRWRSISIDGTLGSGEKFDVLLRPSGKGKRWVKIKTTDAGNMLRTLDVYDTMIGGILDVDATFDDTVVDHPLTGEVLISDYRLIDAPALTQLVEDMPLARLKEALQGDGLAFSEFKAPFVISKGVVDLKDVKATGLSLGYTANGKIYTHAEVIDIEGTVVPAYALNSVLGNIPIIGTLLTGTEDGSGIFAATYRMTGSLENPEVKVNPLSVLAPGIFRNIFGLFADGPNPHSGNTDTDKSNRKKNGKTEGL
jgi:hypothetical protein